MDDDIVYGQALLDAHKTEESLARDPRVILDPVAMKVVHQHLTYYATVKAALTIVIC
jgi:hypothetical protein